MPEPNNPELALRGTDSFTYAFYRHDPQRADHFDVHYHGEYEIIYVPKGSFHYLAGGADYWLHPGRRCSWTSTASTPSWSPPSPAALTRASCSGKSSCFPRTPTPPAGSSMRRFHPSASP